MKVFNKFEDEIEKGTTGTEIELGLVNPYALLLTCAKHLPRRWSRSDVFFCLARNMRLT